MLLFGFDGMPHDSRNTSPHISDIDTTSCFCLEMNAVGKVQDIDSVRIQHEFHDDATTAFSQVFVRASQNISDTDILPLLLQQVVDEENCSVVAWWDWWVRYSLWSTDYKAQR